MPSANSTTKDQATQVNQDHYLVENIANAIQRDYDRRLINVKHKIQSVVKNTTNVKNIKWSLSHAPRKWSHLENEFDKIIAKIETASQKIENDTRMSESTSNLVELFKIHSNVLDKLQSDMKSSDECFICLTLLHDQSPTLKFLGQQKELLATKKPIKEDIKH